MTAMTHAGQPGREADGMLSRNDGYGGPLNSEKLMRDDLPARVLRTRRISPIRKLARGLPFSNAGTGRNFERRNGLLSR